MPELRTFTVSSAQVAACPALRLDPRHFRDDGTCRCTARFAQFEVGETYWCRLITDYDTILRYRVVARTAKFITVERVDGVTDPDGKGRKRLGVRIWPTTAPDTNDADDSTEVCNPRGRYSMAPTLTAEKKGEPRP